MERLTARSENGTAIYKHPVPELEGLKVNRHAVLERCCQYEELEEKLQNTFGECDGLLEELVNSFFKHATAEVKEELKEARKVRLLTDGEVDKWLRWKGLEKEGKLIALPCKPGDTVYTNFSVSGWYMRKEKRPYEAKVVFVGISEDPFFNVKYAEGKMWQFKFSDIGKTVFLAQKEALEALEGMKYEKA